MKNRNIISKTLACAVAAAMMVASALPVAADSATTDIGTGVVAGSVGINGTILPLTISVTHQITMDYTINPNDETITANPITVQNNTKVPVNVTVQSVSSASGGDLTFEDVAPDAMDWNSLTCAESKQYIALGVIANAGGWNAGYNTGTDWAASKSSVLVGSLAPGATGSLALTAKTGLAFDNTYTSKASVVLMIDLV